MKAKKSLGQNFLIDNNIINKIINSINAEPTDLIIEIGPGKGALTRELKKTGARIIAYEVDRDLKSFLDKLEDTNVKVIYQDILRSNILNDIKGYDYNNLIVVGNLPYYITTPIIKYLIASDINASKMYFMVQDEVANRFTAQPNTKEYGSITLFLKYYYNVTKLFKVGKNSFNPIPKVESAIIKFDYRFDKPVIDKTKYFKLLNDAFSFKRKTLKNNLENKDYDWSKITEVLQESGLTNNVRAEQITEDIFLKLTDI